MRWLVPRLPSFLSAHPQLQFNLQSSIELVDFERDTGWVHRSLTGKATHKVVRASVANLRAQPRTGGKLLGKIERGEIVQRLARRGDWVQVQREGGQRGWVASRLLWGG